MPSEDAERNMVFELDTPKIPHGDHHCECFPEERVGVGNDNPKVTQCDHANNPNKDPLENVSPLNRGLLHNAIRRFP